MKRKYPKNVIRKSKNECPQKQMVLKTAKWNDRLRKTLSPKRGAIHISASVYESPYRDCILKRVQTYSFNPQIRENNIGTFELNGTKYVWEIRYDDTKSHTFLGKRTLYIRKNSEPIPDNRTT